VEEPGLTILAVAQDASREVKSMVASRWKSPEDKKPQHQLYLSRRVSQLPESLILNQPDLSCLPGPPPLLYGTIWSPKV
jgi:hypothetical protein